MSEQPEHRFIQDPIAVGSLLAIDDMLPAVLMLLRAGSNGFIATRYRLYIVSADTEQIAALDVDEPFDFIDWPQQVVDHAQWDGAVLMADTWPHKRWMKLGTKPAKPIPHRAPYWWNGNPDTTPVRCLDCRHCPTRVGGRCEATGIYHRGNGYWRRCEAYSERRPTFDARLNPDTQGAIIHRVQERLRQAGHDELAKFARVDDCGEISFWGGIPEDAKHEVLPILRGVMV